MTKQMDMVFYSYYIEIDINPLFKGKYIHQDGATYEGLADSFNDYNICINKFRRMAGW